ncbi:LicD family protein [Ligilactobacillus sp. WILCCON 0076]|uniref:LicD family protein n=1 Tax=Ligilactobacillus ubinensis TaxID=2876789 RepID=A0A9X2FLX7_9LACO|nr:LicD family protein [Ligilactobacillus ubinensis]MCP0886773.1 LicD family protein [Ligilactobacillus ubinensis]
MKIEEIHIVELKLLAKFKQICDKNKLKYFLIGGSLLGAVRHKGFIPWDDDVDVGMLRGDYDKMLRILPQELKDSAYFLQTPWSDEHYGLSYAKLLNCDYTIQEKFNYNDARSGLFIDIFPFDAIPISKLSRNLQMLQYKRYNDQLLLKLNYSPFPLPGRDYIKEKIAQNMEEIDSLKVKREEAMCQYELDTFLPECKNLASQYSYDKEVIERENLDKLKEVPFENLMLNVPCAYDQILTTMYGDYMKLPPVERRINKHLMEIEIINNER